MKTDFIQLLVVTAKKMLVLHPKSRPSLPIDPTSTVSESGLVIFHLGGKQSTLNCHPFKGKSHV